MPSLRFKFERFYDLEDATAGFFRLSSSEAYQGYIKEIGDTVLRFVSGGPRSSYEPFEVPLADIDLETLAYFDEAAGRWTEVIWSADTEAWIRR